MTHLLQNHNPAHMQVCNCATCRSLQNARFDLSAVPMQGMSDSHAEREAANLVIHSERLLATAQSILQQHHIFQSVPPQHSPEQQQQFFGPPLGHGAPDTPAASVSALSNPRPPNPPNSVGSQYFFDSQTGKSGGRASPPKQDGSVDFKDIVRQRAAELGILRDNTNEQPSPPPAAPASTSDNSVSAIENSVSTRTLLDYDLQPKSKFLVCDHCRSHGIRCNESSVCKECIYREVACTHRQCDLSPQSREGCPRTVCFYVHEDWMPDVYGNHNPGDKNWIILPGKLREHLSMGQLNKSTTKSEEETARCYAGVAHRQKHAKKEIRRLVDSGEATWEDFNMFCRCKDMENDEEKTKVLEAQLRRMHVNRIDQQSGI